MFVEVSDVRKSYGQGGSFVQVLNGGQRTDLY